MGQAAQLVPAAAIANRGRYRAGETRDGALDRCRLRPLLLPEHCGRAYYIRAAPIHHPQGSSSCHSCRRCLIPQRSYGVDICRHGHARVTVLVRFSSIKRQRSNGHDETGYRPLAVPYMLMIAAFAMGLLIGFARVYVGVHYPGDIVGGAIDGLIAACIVTLLRRWLRQPTNAILQFAQALRLA